MSFRGFLWGNIVLGMWFAFVVGAISFLFALSDIFLTQRFLWTAQETEVTVVRNEEKEGERYTLYRPIFAIMSSDGSSIEYVGSVWLYPKPHERGEVVKGYYEPSTGVIVSELMFDKEASSSIFLAKFGAMYFLIGAVFLWWRRRGWPKAS